MEILNGTGKPRILLVYNDNSTGIIDLPYCQSLQERFEEIKNQHTMLDKSIEIDRIGYRWGCTLGYRKLMKGITFAMLAPLFDNQVKTVTIIPRTDLPSRKFLCHLANRIQVQRAFAQGHAGIELQFEGLEILSGILFSDVLSAQPVVNDDDVLVINDNNSIPIQSYE